jgi:hypothetical protein
VFCPGTGDDLPIIMFQSHAKNEVTVLKETAIGRAATGKSEELYKISTTIRLKINTKL